MAGAAASFYAWTSASPLAAGIVAIALAVVIAVAFLRFSMRRRKRLGQSPGGHLDGVDLRDLKPADFDALVREGFRRQGYTLIDPPSASATGGLLLLRRERETVLVECRHWRDRTIRMDVIETLQRAMAARGAVSGIVLGTGRFGRDATALARRCNVRLIDGPALRGLVARAGKQTVGRR